MNKLDCKVGFAAVAVLLAAAPALAADADKELATAAQHADYAATASVIDTVHAHLHHTVNCLVGPKGQGFDANSANPCNGMGNGAIPDTADAAKKTVLNQALERANAGLGSNDLAEAKRAARETATMLKNAM